MLKIGDFSKLSRISIRMLRHYDELGLLMPEQIDRFTGYRYYSESQLPTAGRICALRDMGFGLASIAEILKNYADADALARFLEIQRSEIERQEADTHRRLLLLDAAINRLRKDETGMHYNVTLKQLPQRYVASVRMVIAAYDQEQLLWNTLNQEVGCMNLQPAEPHCSLAVFHDAGYKESDVDVEIQVSVKGSHADTEHVKFKTVAPVEYASATYQGSYEKINEVHESVANWVRENHYTFDGASFSIYHVSPAQTQNPQELVTEVCFPVRKS